MGDPETFPFDMFHFLTIITNSSNWKTIKVEQIMAGKREEDKSWIKKLWDASESRLIDEYKQHQFEISFDKHVVEPDEINYFSYECFNVLRM